MNSLLTTTVLLTCMYFVVCQLQPQYRNSLEYRKIGLLQFFPVFGSGSVYIFYYLTDKTKIYNLRPLCNLNLTSISANYPDLWNITVPVQSWLGAHDPHWPECERPGKPDSHLFPKSLWWGHSHQTASDSLHLSDGPKFTPNVQQLWGQKSATVSLCKVSISAWPKIWVI